MTNILVAVLITTNLVSHQCTGGTPGGKCKWCGDGTETNMFGLPLPVMRVPEHVGVIGYDMDWVVTTQYLPVIEMPVQP